MAHLAVAGDGRGAEGLGVPRWRRLNPFNAFAEALAAEGDRRILWLPVFFGTGIAIYFALTVEPPRGLGLPVALAAAALAIALRRLPVLRGIGIALAFAAAGFAVMQEARWAHGTPMLGLCYVVYQYVKKKWDTQLPLCIIRFFGTGVPLYFAIMAQIPVPNIRRRVGAMPDRKAVV